MTERLLQFIWQFQYFNLQALCTTEGLPLQILQPGKYNRNQGPDFMEACIKIDGITLIGNIELHILSSDWNRHGHQHDANYKNVILHVVWQHDMTEHLPFVPLLVLENRIASLLLGRYTDWMQQPGFIPCAAAISGINELVWASWMERLLVERMTRKSNYALQLQEKNKQHWEETCWQLLAGNFGMRVNAAAFENIARSLPLSLLSRHKKQVIVLEALLMGQAGLLEEVFSDEYPLLLQREYSYYRHKYQLRKVAGGVFFLRMRPAGFPTVRLSQLAMLLHVSIHLFSTIRESASVAELRKLLNVAANDYWHYHYRFDEPVAYRIKNLGDTMIDSIIVNTVSPLLFAYGLYHNDLAVKEKALQWLADTAAEKNNIIKGWNDLGIHAKNAAHTQALLELKTQYCEEKRCLDCAVGNALLKQNK